ncbi:MAG: hypothetical protein V4503_12185 [Gemmatimonadota bacterium]
MAPLRKFWSRLGRHFGFSLLVLGAALVIGVVGYHASGFTWINSFLNASMLLGGMGPIGEIPTTGGKLFASFYALFAGLVFIGVSGILLAPILHRLMHRLHLDDEGPRSTRKQS